MKYKFEIIDIKKGIVNKNWKNYSNICKNIVIESHNDIKGYNDHSLSVAMLQKVLVVNF